MTEPQPREVLTPIRAFLFDLDGVITPTAEVHRRAWADLFGPELEARGVAPYTEADYYAHIDGKPRHDGVRDLLASRGIVVPDGDPSDAPEVESVWGLGNRKNEEFARILRDEGVRPYPGSLALIEAAERAGIAMAIVTSSRNGRAVLDAAGLGGRFDVIVDGVRAAELGLPGKPDPATYLRGAHELGVPASACAVLEDALSGVAVGAGGDFGLIVGVDRGAGHDALRSAGAELVIDDLAELVAAVASAHSSTTAAESGQPS